MPELPYSTIGIDAELPIEFIESPEALTITIRSHCARQLRLAADLLCGGCTFILFAGFLLPLIDLRYHLLGFASAALCPFAFFALMLLPRTIRWRWRVKRWASADSFVRIGKQQVEVYAAGSNPKSMLVMPTERLLSIGWHVYRIPWIDVEYLSLRICERRPVLLFSKRETVFWILWPPGASAPETLDRFDRAIRKAAEWIE